MHPWKSFQQEGHGETCKMETRPALQERWAHKAKRNVLLHYEHHRPVPLCLLQSLPLQIWLPLGMRPIQHHVNDLQQGQPPELRFVQVA